MLGSTDLHYYERTYMIATVLTETKLLKTFSGETNKPVCANRCPSL